MVTQTTKRLLCHFSYNIQFSYILRSWNIYTYFQRQEDKNLLLLYISYDTKTMRIFMYGKLFFRRLSWFSFIWVNIVTILRHLYWYFVVVNINKIDIDLALEHVRYIINTLIHNMWRKHLEMFSSISFAMDKWITNSTS